MTSHIPPTREAVIEFMQERDPHTVHATLGVRATQLDPDAFTVEVDVGERLFQHAGIVHGGVYVLLAESAASGAAALTVDVTRFRVAGQEISASHLRPTTAGTLKATARPIHKGRTQIIYAIDVENDGRLVSVCRCTIAVRPLDVP
jgi:1,4-dihydroxy-2-naphthoyl-CoA hydrolase